VSKYSSRWPGSPLRGSGRSASTRDGNVITSNGGPVSYQAAFELLARLSSEDFAKEIRRTIQFDRLKTAFAP
jgi:hypothetical protein